MIGPRERKRWLSEFGGAICTMTLFSSDGSLINLLSGGGEDGVISIIKQEKKEKVLSLPAFCISQGSIRQSETESK